MSTGWDDSFVGSVVFSSDRSNCVSQVIHPVRVIPFSSGRARARMRYVILSSSILHRSFEIFLDDREVSRNSRTTSCNNISEIAYVKEFEKLASYGTHTADT